LTVSNPTADPLLWDTTCSPSAFDPEDWFAYCTRLHGRSQPTVPPLAIQSVINAPHEQVHLDIVARRFGVRPDDFTVAAHPFAVFSHGGQDVVLATSPKGSYAAGGLDELIALGARRIVVLNVGAGMGPDLPVGSLVVASRALRDDGTSFHYQPASRYNQPSPSLTRALATAARQTGATVYEGTVWTNPAHFRLSQSRLSEFRQEGCKVLENEVAAAFAVGHYRQVEVAALVHVGLSLATGRFQVSAEADVYGPAEAGQHLDAALAALTEPGASR
jgi:uridine phosphorylase